MTKQKGQEMYIESTSLDMLLKTHEESTSECIKGKSYQEGMWDARKLLKQIVAAQSSESEWFAGTIELFCQKCGNGTRKPRKGEKYEFCPCCGSKMK